MSEFREYIEHGWSLIPIPPGQKGPRSRGWNEKANCITKPDSSLLSAGLAHAYSGTCALDVDDYLAAANWLGERGVDLDALFTAPDSVQISSGRSGHGKLLYALPEPLASKQIKQDGKCIVDFRCATAGGLTVQDVLPPSIHPGTGNPYKWEYAEPLIGDWKHLPPLPEELHKIWLEELGPSPMDAGTPLPAKGAGLDELRALLQYQEPDANRDEWIKVGMAIHHETNGSRDGLLLWDEWSRQGSKYKDLRELETCWRSFHDTPNAVTVGALRRGAVASPDEFPDLSDATDDPWEAAEAARAARFRLVPVSEVAQRDPPEWIVDGLLPKADLAMIYGPPSAGKSFVALDLAFAASTGFTWFNRSVKPGPVVWIAAEAAGAMRNRARAYAQAHGLQLENAELHIIEQTFSFMDSEDAMALTQAIVPVKPRLIIVDTLAATSGGANENSGEDMNLVLSRCRKLHEATGALVLLIHHSGKDESRGARGWSGLLAAVETQFAVEHQPDLAFRILHVTKQRDGEAGIKMPFRLLPVPLDMQDTTSCVVEVMDESVLDSSGQKLPTAQRIAFNVVNDLAASMAMDSEDEQVEVSLQEVYDGIIEKSAPPAKGKRDMRTQTAQRSLTTLHQKGYITLKGDKVMVGSSI